MKGMRSVGSLVDAVAFKAGPERGRAFKLRACWRSVAGARLADHAQATLSGRTVTVQVSDPRWMGPVRELRAALRERLNDELGGVEVVEVKAGPPRPWTPPSARTGPGQILSEAAPAPLPAALEAAMAAISDDSLRARLRALAAGQRARQRRQA